MLSDASATPVAIIEERFGVEPGGLAGEIEELVGLELVRLTGSVPTQALLLTDLGLKAAGFAKIARQ